MIYGQERVLVAWNLIVFPDGSAMLMSMITGGMSYSMDALRPSGSSSQTNSAPTLQDEKGSALAAQLGQSTMQLLQKNLNIKPTLEIRAGYQFNVIVTKDMIFQQP